MKRLIILISFISFSSFAVEPDQKCLTWKLKVNNTSSFIYEYGANVVIAVSGSQHKILNQEGDLDNWRSSFSGYYKYAKLCHSDYLKSQHILKGRCSCQKYGPSNSKLIKDEVAKAVAEELSKVNTRMHEEYVDDTFSLIGNLGDQVDGLLKAITLFFEKN